MATSAVSVKNKKAFFEFEILQSYTAGIKLMGSEIKSLRDGKANLTDAYCFFEKGELYVKNMHIAEYVFSSHYNHEPKRARKLLLKKSELARLENKIKEKGLTIIPVHLFINDKGLAKLEIALGRGKKLYDKRESIKKRDTGRELDRIKKTY